MSITIYSKEIPEEVKDKIIGDNVMKLLEDYGEDYIKDNLGVYNGK
jgi:hypothetical protein